MKQCNIFKSQLSVVGVLLSICVLMSLFNVYSNVDRSNKQITIYGIKDKENNIYLQSKKVAFMGSIDKHSYRLGGGQFLNITKQMFRKTIVPKSNTILIKSEKIIEYGQNGKLFEKTWCVCNYFLGWIIEWNIDIILWDMNDKNKQEYYEYGMNNQIKNKLYDTIASYDVIFFYSETNNNINWSYIDNYRHKILKYDYNTQYRFYIETEAETATKIERIYHKKPQDFIQDYKKHNLFPINVDVWGLIPHTLNATKDNLDFQWEGIHSIPSITWPYRYPVKWLRDLVKTNNCNNFKKRFEDKILIYITRRTSKQTEIRQFFKDLNNKLINNTGIKKKQWLLWKHNQNPNTHLSYTRYYCKLSITKYVIHFENYISAGQAIGEAAIYGIPTFGYESKYFMSLLMPRFLFIKKQRDENILLEKMAFLENNKMFYNKLKLEIISRANAFFRDYKYTIDDFIYDANQSIKLFHSL